MYPSGAAFAIPLGPTNPWLIYIAKETLVFRRAGFSPALRLLVPTFLLRNAPVWVTPSPSSQMRILSYRLCTSLRIQLFNVCCEDKKLIGSRGRTCTYNPSISNRLLCVELLWNPNSRVRTHSPLHPMQNRRKIRHLHECVT